MKFCARIAFTLSMLSTSWLFAQTVERVNGSEVLISAQGSESISTGEQINFLSNDLEVVGRGEVIKVSEGGKKALVKLSSGKAGKGMSVERLTAEKPLRSKKEVGRTERYNESSKESDFSKDSYKEKSKIDAYDNNLRTNNLSEEDKRILRIGYISTPRYVIGGILGVYPGFGIGHAVQGRYGQRGWVFTAGEIGSILVGVTGAARCIASDWHTTNGGSTSCDSGLLIAGMIGFYGFKIWEIVDVWVTPLDMNERYQELRRVPSNDDSAPTHSDLTWNGMILPTKDGVTAGVRMTF